MDNFNIDPTISYDVVELPSRGIHYPNKNKTLRVAYLTASDENILSSPNLINTNTVIKELLKRKILDKDFSIDDLVKEDEDAILIFLRNTAFGGTYKITEVDPKTSQTFTFEVDLTTIKMKDFNLVEDKNGEYPYTMEKSGAQISFKFLTQKQEDEIKSIEKNWNGTGPAPIVTKQLEFMIKSVNGVRDMMTIHNFVENMPIKDSQDFKKYVAENKPGLDLTQTIKTPSGETMNIKIGLGVEFFRSFYGL
jgi:hypothetical protein